MVLVPQKQLQLEQGKNITCYQSLKNLMKNLVIVLKIKAADFQKKTMVDITLQANLVATTILCLYTTAYILVLDGYSVAPENKLIAPLPIYFVAKQELYLITIVRQSVVWCHNFAVYFSGIAVLLMSYYGCCSNGMRYRFMSITNIIGMMCCIGSAFISLSYHFQDILIAWPTTPFYASRITLFYSIVIFICFIPSKYAYNLSIQLTKVTPGYSTND